MKIETKYDLNQEVWAMKDNKPYSFRIWDIEIITVLTPADYYGAKIKEPLIKYRGYGSSSPWFYEDKLFSTKEELIATL